MACLNWLIRITTEADSMSMYRYVRDLWKRPKENMKDLMRERLIKWRKIPATVRIERPTRIDRARSLGYRAKPGFIVVRQRVSAGGHRNPSIKRGRRPKRYSARMALRKSYQLIAEERAQKKYPNCEVLNSYWVAKDGQYYWYEIILVDRANPQIYNDRKINWISLDKGRVFRGKTSAGRKMRNLDNKGKGAEKARPSRRAKKRRL